jgi:hypothetical protein
LKSYPYHLKILWQYNFQQHHIPTWHPPFNSSPGVAYILKISSLCGNTTILLKNNITTRHDDACL